MQKYGLIGYPLKHSFSIGYFNEKFQSENIDAEYVNFEIPRIEDFMEVIEENPDLCGLNVTIPYKEKEKYRYAAEEYLHMSYSLMHRRIILHHDGKHHSGHRKPTVFGMLLYVNIQEAVLCLR